MKNFIENIFHKKKQEKINQLIENIEGKYKCSFCGEYFIKHKHIFFNKLKFCDKCFDSNHIEDLISLNKNSKSL